MTTEEAIERIKAILGKGLYPTAIPRIEEILLSLFFAPVLHYLLQVLGKLGVGSQAFN